VSELDWVQVVAIGVMATVIMDVIGAARARLTGQKGLDYRFVGRWLGHMPHGQFRHEAIARAAPIGGEWLLGWGVHYATGIVFAAALTWIAGAGWAYSGNPSVALGFGLGTVVVPFLTLQPGLGLGIAAANTPRPWQARWRSCLTHLSFGLGLYLAAQVVVALS